uniref:Tyrosine specific protein phosphatases domain-containing protein n=1 Tax=Desulfovibrio sp. U5L TaxID=596152 RepID=I2Q3D3_9BACT
MADEPTLIFDSIREQGLPNHFRTMAGPFAPPVGQTPSRLGLESLLASGSEQPSLSELATSIRQLAKTVTVIDLRQESHAYLGEHPVSWYGTKNWANQGKSLAEVEDDEGARLEALSKSHAALVSRVYAKDPEGRLSTVRVEEMDYGLAQTERQATRSLGLGYLRLAVTDHMRPLDADVDRFLALVRVLAPNTWLHFHCHAGDGRTTTFLLLYDMLRNAKVLNLEEMAARQHLLGGVDLLHTPHTDWKEALYNGRAAFLGRFFDYARTRDPRTTSWSEHLAG